MYLHLGQDTVVRTAEIIGIFDMDNTTVSGNTRQFLADAEKGGRVVAVSADLPKAFVVCKTPAGGERVYLSQVSAATLYRRNQTER